MSHPARTLPTLPGLPPSPRRRALPPAATEGEAMPSSADVPESTTVNLAVLCGVCPNPPDVRVLESGRRLASLALRTHGPNPGGAAARATSVPVTVWDPPAWLEAVAPG